MDSSKFPGLTPVTSTVDRWLCGPVERNGHGTLGSCTLEQPCLWNVVSDPSERHEVALRNPKLVATLKARLGELKQGFAPNADFNQTCNFCAAAKARGGFCGPWVIERKQD